MAVQPRHHPLARLHIPPHLAGQPQPFDGPPMFSPAFPTAIHNGMFPMFQSNQASVLQTPMTASFLPPHAPPAPGRPTHFAHQTRASMAHLAGPNFHGGPGSPMTPMGQGFPMGGPPVLPQFMPRSRRTASMSVGGPPKAALGGPGRNHNPVPLPAVVAAPPPPKTKKVNVNLPRETVLGEGGEPTTRPSWARTPVASSAQDASSDPGPDLMTSEPYPRDVWRYGVPDTLDVYLPDKSEWEKLKRAAIEEKLEKLGVEKASGSNIPHIHAPHARAASISSPADPALLMFRLNKLQRSQNPSPLSSLATSPQPPLSLSISPNPSFPSPSRLQPRHGQTMSLAQPPSQSLLYNPSSAFNPFGPQAILGSDQVFKPRSPDDISLHPPLDFFKLASPTATTLAPPPVMPRRDSKPDFIRGFGLDVTEEEEETEETPQPELQTEQAEGTQDESLEENRLEEDIAEDSSPEVDGTDVAEEEETTGPYSRDHSRHVSTISMALSLRSVGGPVRGGLIAGHSMGTIRDPTDVAEPDDLDEDVAGEWTGSEDLRMAAETSDDEGSIGEWSNPSDEERARQHRLHRRMVRRRSGPEETPRRLPNFPRPPEHALTFGPIPLVGIDREDDILSNPSEEGHIADGGSYLGINPEGYYPRSLSSLSGAGSRPLPPLPHSRATSAQLSMHDPALAHSRATSDHSQIARDSLVPVSEPKTPGPTLNPKARPFVFGVAPVAATAGSGSWGIPPAEKTPSVATGSAPHSQTHSRSVSFGKALNAAAVEFKPGGFTFRPPPGVPALNFPVPQIARPLPDAPEVTPSARAEQGREKRQRRSSDPADVSEEEHLGDAMTAFRFPSTSPQSVRKTGSAPGSPTMGHSRSKSSLNAAAKPFTFSGFSAVWPAMAREATSMARDSESPDIGADAPGDDAAVSVDGADDEETQELPDPPKYKPKRAPIPLDFKLPMTSNTVPAGLFKALNNGSGSDERTRRAVRSRLGSREIFDHVPRRSLDDINVGTIARRTSVAAGVEAETEKSSSEPRDVFSSVRRPFSRTPRSAPSPSSDMSVPDSLSDEAVDMSEIEERLGVLLDEKLDSLRQDLRRQHHTAQSGRGIDASTESMITEVVTLFRAQLQESASRGLDDSQMDARGELDFQLIKDIVEQGHAESRAVMQHDLAEIVNRLSSHQRETDSVSGRLAEEIGNKTASVILDAIPELVAHVEQGNGGRVPSPEERGVLAQSVVSALIPHLATLRSEPIDYMSLTQQLTQAVKPHISQLIDFASDKRETAGIIVDTLAPMLHSLLSSAPAVDVDALGQQLVAEIRRVVAPYDAHELKEQVSDLVVERIDSRLAVRDRALNVDQLLTRVNETVSHLRDPLTDVSGIVRDISEGQRTLISDTKEIVSAQTGLTALLYDIPQQLSAAVDSVKAFTELQPAAQQPNRESDKYLETIPAVKSVVDELHEGQKSLASQVAELVSLQQDVVSSLDALPEALVAATKVLDGAHADLLARDTSYKKDLDEVRRTLSANAELQVQLVKARTAHGQVRVEKDMLNERLIAAEAERDRLRTQLDERLSSTVAQESDLAAARTRNVELEAALAQALERLKASDVNAQTQQARFSELEKKDQEASLLTRQLSSKVDTLDLKLTLANRDKESTVQTLALLREEHDRLVANQNHWEDLRRASEQIQLLSSLVKQSDDEELRELKAARDRSKVLEGEHSALQKRFKEQEARVANTERNAFTARQTLAQANDRAIEWEKRVKDHERDLLSTRTQLITAEQARAQQEADFVAVQSRLEEREADESRVKDRESKLRDQVAALEGTVAELQLKVDRSTNGTGKGKAVNGHVARPVRSPSPASTVFGQSRSSTPTGGLRTSTPPEPSVWDSIHAPKPYGNLGVASTPVRRPQPTYHRAPPSPTLSVASVASAAPTLQDDGWWA